MIAKEIKYFTIKLNKSTTKYNKHLRTMLLGGLNCPNHSLHGFAFQVFGILDYISATKKISWSVAEETLSELQDECIGYT